MKLGLGSHRFENDREVEAAVTRRLITEDTELYQTGIEKLVQRCKKYLNCVKVLKQYNQI